MSLPDIDFDEIRTHRGTQYNAFEELCCQLAEDEPLSGRVGFDRKGPGADGGVECYATLSDGSEVGWQVKYYANVGSATKSLDESLATALVKHPKMTRFIACVPFDLSDSRIEDVTTAAMRWTEWKDLKIADAAKTGRTIEIERWDSFELKNRMTGANPASAGRIAFWFDKTLFTQAWFEEKFGRAHDDLQQRYTPESHIDLPIRKSILATLRDASLFDELAKLKRELRSNWQATTQDDIGSDAALTGALNAFDAAVDRANATVPIGPLRQAVEDARKAVSTWHRSLRQPDEGESKPQEVLGPVSSLLSTLQTVDLALRAPHWDHLNTKCLLVLGEAGTGKSHLLADACSHQIKGQAPAIMVLGGKLPDNNPWASILQDLDLGHDLKVQEFLSALNAAGQAAGVRTLIAIDALNEGNGQAIWPDRLKGFLFDAGKYEWISVVLSCRSTYEEVVIPDDLDPDRLPRVEHEGFSLSEARLYLKRRGVSLPETPNHVAEFSRPLFLKICCDALKLEGEAWLPSGLGSVTAVFDLYTRAVIQKIHKTLGLVANRKFPQKALSELAFEMARTGKGYVPLDRAQHLVDAVLSGGKVRDDLLFALQGEGMLTEEMVGTSAPQAVVRFTFERIGDHAIASILLDRSIVDGDIRTACAAGSPMATALSHPSSHIKRGLLEALAVLLPERHQLELQDLPGLPASMFVATAFEKSLLSRKADAITARTWTLVDVVGGQTLRYETLIALSTDPGHPYNAEFLDQQLQGLRMPERDALWSAHIALPSNQQAQKLIDWARQADAQGIDRERVSLTAVQLCWFLTTSSRVIRDTATKALVSVLADHPGVAPQLWRRFKGVDDGYLTERLVAAIYGAALQGRWAEWELSKIIDQLYADLLAGGEPPANILLRDHLVRLVRYGRACGVASPSGDPALTDGPFKSPWPIEYVSDEAIASYTRTYGSGYVGRDEITSSCFDGDFARYQLDYAVDNWSVAPRGATTFPTRAEVGAAWFKRFSATATPEALAAFDALQEALTPSDEPKTHSERRAAGKEEKAAFREAIGEMAYAEWQAEAEDWRIKGMYQQPAPRDGVAQFNFDWARRWVCKRAHDLGWTGPLHGAFDALINNDRMTHTRERIGKKYQWLALYELCARMQDNLEPLPGQTDDSIERLRNIDPSLLRAATADDGWRRFDTSSFWVPQIPNLDPIPVEEALAWLRCAKDIFDGAENIEVTDPNDGRSWLVLTGFESWRTQGDDVARDTFRRVGCMVVEKGELAAVLDRIAGTFFQGGREIPKGRRGDLDTSYLGEHPWAWVGDESFRERDLTQLWLRYDPDNPLPDVMVLPTTTDYLAESVGYDASVDENINLFLPAAWLADELDLQLSDGASIEYEDADRVVRFMDPSVSRQGRSAALIDRELFLKFLDEQGLVAIWAIGGEKNVYGSPYSSGYGGKLTFTRLFVSDGDKIVAKERIELFEEPEPSQLAALMGQGEHEDGDDDGDESEELDVEGEDDDMGGPSIAVVEDSDWDDILEEDNDDLLGPQP